MTDTQPPEPEEKPEDEFVGGDFDVEEPEEPLEDPAHPTTEEPPEPEPSP